MLLSFHEPRPLESAHCSDHGWVNLSPAHKNVARENVLLEKEARGSALRAATGIGVSTKPAIGDCGVGVRNSLSTNPPFAYVASLSHHEAAALAFQPKVTAKPSGGGTGLWDVRDAVRQLGGRMRLATGDGYVQDWRGQMRMGQMAFELPGVQVEISIPVRG